MRIVFGVVFFGVIICINGLLAQEAINRSPEGLDCTADFLIHKFKTSDTGSAMNKPWKIVIGREIEYRAKPGNGSDWNWQLGKGACNRFSSVWNLQGTVALNQFFDRSDASNKALIPLSDMPRDNSFFGTNYGTIKVSNRISSTCKTKPEGKKAMIYFEKDEVSNPMGGDPNWFYYWSQIPLIQNVLEISGIHLFNTDSGTFNPSPTNVRLSIEYAGFPYTPPSTLGPTSSIYGENVFSPLSMTSINYNPGSLEYGGIYSTVVEYDASRLKIRIGEGCGQQKVIFGTNSSSYDKGIHVFYRTVVHEVEHAKIDSEVWSYTHPSEPDVLAGCSNFWDMDRDGYKDVWERYSTDAMMYGFMVNPSLPSDSYTPNYGHCYDTSLSSDPNSTCSTGTRYEEDRCRTEEINLNPQDIDQYDWSFDPSNSVQGKQW